MEVWYRSDAFFSSEDSETDGHEDFGVHIDYTVLYNSLVFLATVWIAGKTASSLFRMPALVGEIMAGILLGPPLADFVPNPHGWVIIGEIGYVICILNFVLFLLHILHYLSI
jgi:Kef-type K+ transport system membrane component KefB